MVVLVLYWCCLFASAGLSHETHGDHVRQCQNTGSHWVVVVLYDGSCIVCYHCSVRRAWCGCVKSGHHLRRMVLVWTEGSVPVRLCVSDIVFALVMVSLGFFWGFNVTLGVCICHPRLFVGFQCHPEFFVGFQCHPFFLMKNLAIVI